MADEKGKIIRILSEDGIGAIGPTDSAGKLVENLVVIFTAEAFEGEFPELTVDTPVKFRSRKGFESPTGQMSLRLASLVELSGGEKKSDETDGIIQEMHELRRSDGSFARAGVIDSDGKKATFDAESLAQGVSWADLFAAWKKNKKGLEVFYVDIGPGIGGTRMADRVRLA